MGQAQPGGRRAFGLIIIAAGVFFLLVQFGVFSFDVFGFLWPFFIIVPGLVFLYFARTGGEDLAPLAIPGAIITGTGAILLFQSVTDRWESWAYIWTLYPVFLGLGLIFMGRRTQSRKTYRSGVGFVRWGMIAFAVFAGFFELFVFGDFGFARYLIPVALILAGGWMLLRGQRGGEGGGSPRMPGRKRKPVDYADEPLLSEDPVVLPRRHVPRASDDLRRKIDLALAEDDDLAPVPDGPNDNGDAPADDPLV
jgi:hypothetical protein